MGEPSLAAAQRLSVPTRDTRGSAGTAALPVLPCGPEQHTGNRQVCVCESLKNIQAKVPCWQAKPGYAAGLS